MMLESYMHGDSVFVTLTYEDEHLPEGRKALARSLQLFLKRLRKALPQRIRYYIALEYGKLGRAHFHGILFNVSRFDTKAIDEAWGMGFTQVGECNAKTINYVTKYVTKGDTRAKDESKQKTFARMSRNPGIGKSAVERIGNELLKNDSATRKTLMSDVPPRIKFGPKGKPLGRYLTGELRKAVGVSDGREPQHRREQRLQETANEIRSSGTQLHIQADESARKSSALKAEFAIKLKSSKEKL